MKDIFCFDFPKGNLNALGKINFFLHKKLILRKLNFPLEAKTAGECPLSFFAEAMNGL